MKLRYKKILSKFQKANVLQKYQMFQTLNIEIDNLLELQKEMSEIIEHIKRVEGNNHE